MESLKMYVMRGVRYGTAALLVSLCICFLLRLTAWKKAKADRKTKNLWFLSIWYFVTLELVVFWGRDWGFMEPMGRLNLHLLENLRDAVRVPGHEVLVQVGLNLLMFIPGGFLLGWLLEKKKGYAVPLTLLGIILFNESVQYFTGWGGADVDDLLTNMIGGLWGWAVFLLVRNRKQKGAKGLAAAGGVFLPLVLAVGLLLAYQLKPWGYLPQDVINDGHLKPKTVDVSAIEDSLPESLSVYEPLRRDKKDAREAVEKIFSALDIEADFDSENAYDTVVVYRQKDGPGYIWYWYRGAFDLNLGSRPVIAPYPDMSVPEQTLAILADMGYPLPLPAEVLEDPQSGTYTLVYDFTADDGELYDGTLEVTYFEDELLKVNYDVTQLNEYRTEPALDGAGLIKRLQQGRFTGGYSLDSIDELVCLDCTLDYALDSKGYYRPVYVISCTINGRATEIRVSAI